MNAKLFINYRRDDTRHAAGRLYDRLTTHFSDDQVFMDIDQIEPGEDFVEAINRKVSICDIAIVLIGPRWLHATDASGKRRLDDEEDFVRMEIVAALRRNIRVIPVLVDRAQMPRKEDLPEALAPLSRRNAIELSETRFHADVNRLIEAIEKSLAVPEKKPVLSATSTAPLAELTAVRPQESKDLPKASGSAKPAEPKEADDIPPLGASISTTAALESQVWTRKRLIIVSAIGTIVILMLALAGFLRRPDHNPGVPYPRGDGVPKDFGKARELFQEAANQGNAEGQYNLGVVYARGDGVRQDLGKAADLYQKAANQGYEPAITQLKALSRNRK